MIPELRQRFNANFTLKKYQDFLQALSARCRTEIHFRVCETPAFFPESLINTMARYGDELMQQLLGNPDYRRESNKSIPARWNVPNEDPTPLFVSVDFGLIRDESGKIHPKLVELQAFPTLYGYQAVLGQQYKESFGLPSRLKIFCGDLDLGFGTAGLDFNQDPPQGIADAVFSPDRVDTGFIDRLLSKCTDHLSLLAAPATLDRVYDFATESFDGIFDSLRVTMPCIVLDIPHQWSGWTRRALVGADDILVVAEPDLANLRNAKNLLDLLKAARPNDRRPYYCLNQVGVPKRPEISAGDFAKALDDQPIAVIPFEPQVFGTAANNGQMIAEFSNSHRVAETFRQLAQVLTGRSEAKKGRSGLLAPFFDKLRKRQA